MIYLKTTITSLGREEAVRIANIALRWCKRELGVNKRKKYAPVWSIIKGYDTDVGEYDADENCVYVYWDNCDSVEELIRTCIHEWTHQNQPIKTKYFKYPGSYSRNPYERAARYAEDKHYKACFNYIKKQTINKWKKQ